MHKARISTQRKLFIIGMTFVGVAFALGLFAYQSWPSMIIGGLVAAGYAALLYAPLPGPIKTGLTTGLIGVLFMLTYGIEKPAVALLASLLAGLAAGLLSSQRNPTASPRAGALRGALSGLVAGAITVLTLLIVWQGVAEAAGVDAREFLNILIKTVPFGAGISNDITLLALLSAEALALATVFGGLAGLARALGQPGAVATDLPHRPGGLARLVRLLRLFIAKISPFATLILLGAIVLIIPLLNNLTNLQLLNKLIPVYVYVLLALGLNIVVGYAGLLDLGYAAFFAIGAYTIGILSSKQFEIQIGFSLSFWLVIWIAAAVAAVAGIILGAPTLPLRGDYLAIVTLGFGEIVPIMVRNLGGGGSSGSIMLEFFGYKLFPKPLDLTGGEAGISAINPPSSIFTSANQINWYYLIVALMALTIFLINRLRDSRQGRAWTAIREDELAADAMGINTVRTKLLAFAMGATFSGFAGAFYGAYVSAIFPRSFEFSVSVIVLCMVILGGLGSMVGVIVGGLLIMGADRMFLPTAAEVVRKIAAVKTGSADIPIQRDPEQLKQLLFGLVLVVMMLVRPEGLLPNPERRAELHADDETADQENAELYDAERDPQLAGH